MYGDGITYGVRHGVFKIVALDIGHQIKFKIKSDYLKDSVMVTINAASSDISVIRDTYYDVLHNVLMVICDFEMLQLITYQSESEALRTLAQYVMESKMKEASSVKS